MKHLQILFSDDDVLVVNKPPGITVIPDRKGSEALKQILEARFGAIFIVHRIDRDTSGVVVFARNAEAHRYLSMQFELHSVLKKYSVLVHGRMQEKELIIDKPIGKHPRKANVMIISSTGKSAYSVCHPLENFKHFTLDEVEIKTGRTHQIRVHLQHAGYPLMIDSVYSKTDAFFLSQIKSNFKNTGDEKPLMNRLSLHALSISFQHPVTDRNVTVIAPLPDDFTLVLKMLRKYDSLHQSTL